jgi:hypothetical protein
LFTWPVFHFFTASSGKISSKAADSVNGGQKIGEKHMLRRQMVAGMSGVFTQCVYRGGTNEAIKETRIAQLIAMSFGILWAVVIALTVMNGQ